jgi:CBS-domain-containing membrane protein
MRIARAGDLMIPIDKYPHVPYWFTLRQTMVELESSALEIDGRKSLPRVVLVFDEKYQLMGMVRRRDILRGLEPADLARQPLAERRKLFDKWVADDSQEALADVMKGVRDRSDQPVREVMVPVESTAQHDDHIVKVDEMNSNRTALLPVLRDGKVVGVIRSVDVFHEFSQFIL